MKIALEGMDGCGKTSIARILSERLGYKYANRQLRKVFNYNKDQYEDLCQKLYATNDNVLKSLFFTLDNYVSLNTAKDVILDRHFLSTSFWNCDRNSVDLLTELSTLVVPDLTIILYADADASKRHIQHREKQSDIHDSKKMSLGYDDMVMFARRYNYPFILVDEDKMTYQEIIDVCEQIIKIAEKLSEKELHQFCQDHEVISKEQEIRGVYKNEKVDLSNNQSR